MSNRFWRHAARAALWLNKIAWRVYALSERLRVATQSAWLGSGRSFRLTP